MVLWGGGWGAALRQQACCCLGALVTSTAERSLLATCLRGAQRHGMLACSCTLQMRGTSAGLARARFVAHPFPGHRVRPVCPRSSPARAPAQLLPRAITLKYRAHTRHIDRVYRPSFPAGTLCSRGDP